MYLCVLNRMQWVCCVHNLPVYCTFIHTKLALRAPKRVSQFYESNESMISESKSNPQNNGKIHFTLHLNLNLRRIKLTFVIDPPWDGRHQPGTSLLW